MPALNFKARFAADVESGKKRQTIRPIGKRKYHPGDQLYLYTEQRTKKSRKLGEAVCLGVKEIKFDTILPHYELIIREKASPSVWVQLSNTELGRLARKDGFRDWIEMATWFDNKYNFDNLPLNMQIIKWGDIIK
jgi:hypothetical protein